MVGRQRFFGTFRPTSVSKAQRRDDLRYFAKELPKRHKNLYHATSAEQFARAVAELEAAIPSLQDHQIIVKLHQIAATVGDGHTGVARALFTFIDKHPTTRLVVDMPQNGGGDFFEGRKHLVSPLRRHPVLNQKGRLPHSRLVVSYSTRCYKFLDEDVPAVMPGIRIDPSWTDFQAGRDGVMDWILRAE